jgi:predicted component of type VI protein secretion system
MSKCPFCNFENEDGALFCEQCKTDLGAEPVAVAESDTGFLRAGLSKTDPDIGPITASEPAHALPLSADQAHAETIPLAPAESAAPMAALVVEAVRDPDAVPLAEVPAEKIAMAEAVPSSPAPVAEAAPMAMPVESPAAVPVAESTLAVEPPAAKPAEDGKLPDGAKPKLVVMRGERINVVYTLYEGDNFVGRADEKPVDVDLEDQEPPDRVWSSRQHALITLENGQLAIEDLSSLNGTFVNRTRVQPGQKRPLQVNDVIQIGTVQMKVKL